MCINKIVLATTVFGFVASVGAMENLEKLTAKEPGAAVFLQKNGSLDYKDSAYSLINYSFVKLPPQLQRYRFFGTRFTIEKSIVENNFVRCNFANGRKAIVCGTIDEKACREAEDMLTLKTIIRETIKHMPRNDSEGDGYRPGDRDSAYNYDFYNHRYVDGGE